MSDRKYECHFPGCGLRYSRKEHLNRHAAQHSRMFPCSHCASTFRRSDSLRRHMRHHHSDVECNSSRRPKACDGCSSRKSRCTGGIPCDRCTERNKRCSLERHSPDSKDEQMSMRQSNNDLSSIQHYIDIYFNQFHPAWPILHRGSFDKDNEPALLVQTVYMIGLWLSGDAVAKDAAKSLHQRHRVLIEQQKDQWDSSYTEDDRNISPWPTATYQAILLHIIFSLISRRQSSVGIDLKLEISASDYHLLYALVKTCIKQGMFCYTDILAHSSDTAPIVCVWAGVEEIKRFAMALYKVCKSCEVRPALDEHQIHPHNLLTLGDLHFTLPDDDYLWDARTHEELTDRLALQARVRGRTSNSEGDWISSCRDTVLSSKVKFDWI